MSDFKELIEAANEYFIKKEIEAKAKFYELSSKIMKDYTDPDVKFIYGSMYGTKEPDDEFVKIDKTHCDLNKANDAFIYIWGYPGPDYNLYKFTDYGITWAFRIKDLKREDIKFYSKEDQE